MPCISSGSFSLWVYCLLSGLNMILLIFYQFLPLASKDNFRGHLYVGLRWIGMVRGGEYDEGNGG